MDWHPRQLAEVSEWMVLVPGQREPIAILRRLHLGGRPVICAVTGAPLSSQRELIGYFATVDEAAEQVWRRYIAAHEARHARASRTHGSDERMPSQPSGRQHPTEEHT